MPVCAGEWIEEEENERERLCSYVCYKNGGRKRKAGGRNEMREKNICAHKLSKKNL